ncbi:RraA family protein [Candidimonas sp. SYP-B2681]|uniref:RraA family protein n=1 Tax=Candidimonas sp. SYP-B2681 TaxID=2497686 RepID=UPI000F89033B|nr:RraA family protein [Candidimonas sp. SYP-B2681]RTZ48047.1 RraA family protein [Candidimonas sp. SYP-B2681]
MEHENLDWLSSTLLADRGARVLACRIKPLQAGWRIFARALTVSVPPGDNLAIHAALSIAREGDVLVVSGEGYLDRALMGGIMCGQAAALKMAGVVIDGAVRDVVELRAGSFPVFAAGISPAGPTKHGDGSVFRSVVCGGVGINPGDWIFGDEDGVVTFSEEERTTLVRAAAQKLEAEHARIAAINRGDLAPAWLQADLERASVDIAGRP